MCKPNTRATGLQDKWMVWNKGPVLWMDMSCHSSAQLPSRDINIDVKGVKESMLCQDLGTPPPVAHEHRGSLWLIQPFLSITQWVPAGFVSVFPHDKQLCCCTLYTQRNAAHDSCCGSAEVCREEIRGNWKTYVCGGVIKGRTDAETHKDRGLYIKPVYCTTRQHGFLK